MPTYKLTMGTSLDLTLNRLAKEHNTTVGDILKRAVATYATLKKYPEVYVKMPPTTNDSSIPPNTTGLRRIALP